MSEKNLLLGYGETLTKNIPTPGKQGDKAYPYSYLENKEFVVAEIRALLDEFKNIPKQALPNNQAVIKLTLHPSFLAKSYFPTSLLKKFSLTNIGSKSLEIKPRKQTLKRPKELLVTSCLFISGDIKKYEELLDSLNNDTLSKNEKIDIQKIEELNSFTSKEKVKFIKQRKDKDYVEIALHTPEFNHSIIEDFVKFAKGHDVEINTERLISVKGLSFVPAKTNSKTARKLAEFSFLRVIRDLSKIRIHDPIIQRTINSSNTLKLPVQPAQDQDIKVGIFDGGIGITDLDLWCKETKYSSSSTSGAYLSHGQDVTSTVLFGIVDDEQDVLPIPYSNVQHFRVIDNTLSPEDNDLFSVLKKIQHELNNQHFDFINLSLGPQEPVIDDDVNVWTATLEDCLSDGKTLCTVAVGNDGLLDDGLNRIQPPSDMVNALAVGASTTYDEHWEKCDYSCVGPGRSPGFIKPDGLAFGGTNQMPFSVFSPIVSGLSKTAGTSFAAPLVLRQAIGLVANLRHKITPLTAKALLIHHADNKNNHDSANVGYGLFPHNLEKIIYCDDNEIKVIYQGELKPSQYLRAFIPFPDTIINGKVTLKATFCFNSSIDPEHPINYTRNGLSITFRHKFGSDESKTMSFFSLNNSYQTEQEQRKEAHKWEVTLHKEQTFLKGTLDSPCFDIVYQAREQGRPADNRELEPLPYVLIVSLKAENTPDLYNSVRQKYQTLEPIKVEQRVIISSD
jgi:hypothetical protein